MDSLAEDLERLRTSVRPRRRHLRRRGPQLAWVGGAVVILSLAYTTGDVLKQLDEVRGRRRVARQVADDASRAGARLLDPRLGQGPEAACRAAWSAVVDRLGDAAAQPADCSGLAGPCTPGAARRVTGRAGGSTVAFTYPAGGTGPQEDRCRQLAVGVEHRNGAGLAASLGLVSRRTTVSSVAASVPGVDEYIPLVVLDPSGCRALAVSGRVGLQVSDSDGEPGLLLVESDGSAPGEGDAGCQPVDRWVIDVGDDAFVRALPGLTGPGRILSHALTRSAPRAYERVDARAGAACGERATPPCHRLQPRPTRAPDRRGRDPLDRRYNCLPPACADGDHVDDVVRLVGAPGRAPAGFLEFPRPGTPDRCELPASTPALTLTGNWYVRCPGVGPGSGFRVHSSVALGDGAVVFEGGVTVGSGGSLSVNAGGSRDEVVAIRSGGLATTGTGALSLARTFVHLAPGATLDLGANGPLTWTAPQDGPFRNLAVWGDGGAAGVLAVRPGVVLDGVFFLPDAELRVEVSGATEVTLGAQVVVGRMTVLGDGVVALGPPVARTVRYPVARARLVG